MTDRSTRRELAATIRSIAQFHDSTPDRKTSPEFVIASMRDLGLTEEADHLERLVVRIRSQRAHPP